MHNVVRYNWQAFAYKLSRLLAFVSNTEAELSNTYFSVRWQKANKKVVHQPFRPKAAPFFFLAQWHL